MTEDRLYEYLGDQVGEATREDVLKALRGHCGGTVIVELELLDGTPMLHVQGTLMEADPHTEEPAEEFVIIAPGLDAQVWALRPEFRKEPGRREIEGPTYLWHVPEKGIEQYLGVDAGCAGYRFDLGGGVKLAVLLWQDVLHVTDSGDLAPGMGDFRIALEAD